MAHPMIRAAALTAAALLMSGCAAALAPAIAPAQIEDVRQSTGMLDMAAERAAEIEASGQARMDALCDGSVAGFVC